jgi:hypothetical protein
MFETLNLPGKLLLAYGLLMLAATSSGCAWLESLRGEGFPEWNETIGENVRKAEPEAKPSGMFFSRKADQIESSLGGNFD